ncbi:DNA replication complex GINS protein PSF3 [Beauveria bassiana D1-5]|uniref:DNA replication complex GINS protein PSF3 n=1 Tax=Beauveria bassiana D1-5 TaxID=1245745 RepID=A0A0A2VD09_BEABA|nr:DNA replication complex GINS protein PSF3 [Beauveria bassiana D1-5]
MSYYDIDAILTDAEKVPCQFELDVPYLGHLDNNPHGLKPGTSLLLPLWLAEMLALASSGGEDSRAPLTLNLPPCLSDGVVAALKADPRAVALRDQSPHFFGVCVRMLDLFDERELGAVLRRTFIVRAADGCMRARPTRAWSPGSARSFCAAWTSGSVACSGQVTRGQGRQRVDGQGKEDVKA